MVHQLLVSLIRLVMLAEFVVSQTQCQQTALNVARRGIVLNEFLEDSDAFLRLF